MISIMRSTILTYLIALLLILTVGFNKTEINNTIYDNQNNTIYNMNYTYASELYRVWVPGLDITDAVKKSLDKRTDLILQMYDICGRQNNLRAISSHITELMNRRYDIVGSAQLSVVSSNIKGC